MKTKSIEKFIAECKLVHGDKYDYSKVQYINAWEDIEIICPVHKSFFQCPTSHRKGSECRKCSNVNRKNNILEKSLNKFLVDADDLYGDTYDYSQIKYLHSRTNINLVCDLHGSFPVTPEKHIKKGHYCPVCRWIKTPDKSNNIYIPTKMRQRNFHHIAGSIHNHFYTYKRVKWGEDKILITCPIHGDFWQKSHKHLAGQGCRKCNQKAGWSRERYEDGPATLYYAKINNYYKIGICINGTIERFRDDRNKGMVVDIIREENYLFGVMAYDEEERILRKYLEHRYYGEKILESGNTELFTKDVLNLDN